jgi:hypothetical protein
MANRRRRTTRQEPVDGYFVIGQEAMLVFQAGRHRESADQYLNTVTVARLLPQDDTISRHGESTTPVYEMPNGLLLFERLPEEAMESRPQDSMSRAKAD